MKKEANGKKGKWLWLVLGIVVLLAVVGVVLAFVLGGQDDTTAGGRPDLYWNVDREANVDRDTGLSIREAAEDGNYYVRFAHDGEQVEIPVADKKLVNYIDSLDLMSLTLDDNGFAVDVAQVKDVASIVGESLYVQSVDGNTVIANSAITMNGRKITIELNEDAGVYNVSGKGEFVGEQIEASTLNPMDTISVYGTFVPEDSEEETVVTHIYVLNKPAESAVYWRADVFYDSTNKVTTREPDENGAYTIKWYVDGETVELKCKDKDLVTTIDSANYHWCHWGLEFDEDGYIVAILDSFLASRTLLQCERYDITEVYDDGSYTATSLIKNNGAFVQGVVGADCAIYDISKTAQAEGQANRKVDSLKLGDRVCIWTDTMGNPVLIYVTNRIVEGPAYWNVTRSYDSTTKLTTRTPNANGMYEIELLKAGDTKNTIYYAKDIETATAVDFLSDRCMGLKLGEGNVIEYVYDIECVFGYTYFVRGYYILDATASVCTYLTPSGSGYTKNGVLGAGAKVWNISTVGKYGEETTLQPGDYVYAGKTPTGEVSYAYVLRRALENGENMFYWRLSSRMYDTVNKVTTREPDADGYYVYEFAHNGKIVTLKTKNKDFATTLDYQSSAPAYTLEVKGDIIVAVHEGTYAFGGSRINGWTVTAINGNEFTATSSTGSESTYTLADGYKVYNVSSSVLSHKGEKTTLKVGDVIAGYRNMYGQIQQVIVKSRETNKMAWPVAPQYDSTNAVTTRVPDKNGWYTIQLAVDGKVQTYKTKNINVISAADSYTTAFGIQVSGDEILYTSSSTYVKDVKGSGVTSYTVTSANSSTVKVIYTLGHSANTGTTQELPLSSNVKIYDVSATAKNFGGSVKLQKGDVIRTYKDDDDNHLYIYVLAHATRDYLSYCDHCKKAVYWTPYNNGANVVAFDSHYYLSSDLTITSQLRVYSTARDFETVLDLNGHTIIREGGRAALVRYGDTLTIIDSVGGGTMTTKNNTSNGGVIMIAGSSKDGIGVVNMRGGILTVQKSDDSTKYSAQGGIITNSGGIFNLYDGEVKDGIVYGKTSDGGSGGNIRVSGGAFNMYGGKVSGGKAYGGSYDKMTAVKDANGNDVIDPATGEVKKEPVPTLASGYGGNIYLMSGEVNIYGGTIENGQASRGGNVYVGGGTFTMEKGTVTGGVADATTYGRSSDGRGGNFFNAGDLYIKGGTVSGGTITSGYNAGGNIMSTGLSDTVYISGNAVVTGGAADSGNNIYLMYSNLVVSGGTIANGSVTTGTSIGSNGTTTGGNSSITISGGKIDGTVSLGGSTTADETAKYPDYRTALTLMGGTVEKISASKVYGDLINVSGKPVVKHLSVGTALLKVGKMESGANVTVDTIGIFTTKNIANAASYTGYFHPVAEGFLTGTTADNELKFYHPDSVAAPCEHCFGAEADWMPWDGTSVGNGHYFMTDNVQLTEQLTVPDGADMVLDLKGYTVTAAENSRVFYLNGGLNVFDTSDAQTGTITGGRATRGGNIYVTEKGAFALWSGTVTGGVADNALGTSTTNGRGGNIFSNGYVVLAGGTVSNGSVIGGSNYGGNIMSTGINAGILIGGDATVIGGTAEAGHNIYLMYSNLAMAGGSVLNGSDGVTTTSIGTNATATGGYCTIEIVDGVVDGIIALGGNVSSDAEVAYPDYRTELTVSGGEIAQINASRAFNDVITIEGAPVIDKLTLGSGVLIDAAELTSGASIKVGGTGVITTPFATKEAADAFVAAGYIIPTSAGVEVVATDAYEVEIKTLPVATEQKYCEHCEQTVEFSAWHGIAIAEDGHYFLENNIQLTDVIVISKNVVIDLNGYTVTAAANSQAFDISGNLSIMDSSAAKTGAVTGGSGYRGGNIYVQKSGSFTLYSGSITNGVADTTLGSGTTGGRGGNIFGNGGTVTLKGGVVSGGTTVNGSNWGGNIFMTGGTLTVEEGAVISGGNATTGGNVYLMYAAMVMTGGEIKEGVATNCDGVYLRGSGGNYSSLTMSGGYVSSVFNYEAESTVSVSGTAQIENLSLKGMLTVGEMADGASIKINATEGVFTDALTNANAVVGYFDAVDSAYNVAVSADNKLEIVADPASGGEGGGETPDPEANCEHCNAAVEWVEWDGATVDAGHYILTGNVDLSAKLTVKSDMVLDLNGYTITAVSGLQAFQVNGTMTILDTSETKTGTITGGKALNSEGSTYVSRGGNFIVPGGGTLNIYGGNIVGGEAVSRGGNIYVTGSSTLNIYGGTVSGGVAGTHANNIYSNGSTINIYGGTIINTVGNGVYNVAGSGYSSNGDFSAYLNISGGTISGGDYSIQAFSASSGSSVTEVTISGGTIIGKTYIKDINKLEISGNPVIEELVLGSETSIINVLGTLTEGASVKVNAAGAVVTAPLADADTAAAALAYIDTVAHDKVLIVNASNELEVAAACPCGCKELVANVEWKDANAYIQALSQLAENNNVIAENVHLRLSDDLDITAVYNSAKQISIGADSADVNVTIDLNGKTWSSTNRIYNYEGCTLTILDTSTEGTGTMISTGRSNAAHGGIIANYGTLNIYSGTFTQPAGGSKVSKGGVVYQSKGVFNLYGGTITGGQTVVGASSGALGGNVHIYGGTFNMYGGTISDGIAQSDALDQGGNVYIRWGATFNMYGGTITGGTADEGDSVFMAVGTSTGSVLNMAGGEINAVYVPSALAAVNVSGTAVIGDLNLQADAIVTPGLLVSGASIGITKDTAFTDVLVNAENYVPYFHSAYSSKTAGVDAEGKLILVESCPCGCGTPKDEVVWTDLNAYLAALDTDAETAGVQLTVVAEINADTHFYLSDNLNVSSVKNQIFSVGSTTAANATIDLKGYTLSVDRRTYVYANSTLTVMDSSEAATGVWSSTGKAGLAARVIANYGTFNLCSGTLMMTENAEEVITSGSVVYLSGNGSVFNMYGGKVLGGRADGDTSIGGNVCVRNGTAFYMYGGEIAGGAAAQGSNVYVYADGTFVNEGGTIEDAENTVYIAE